MPRIDTLTLICEYPEENVYEQIKHLCILKNPHCRVIKAQSKDLEKSIKELNAKDCNLLIVDDQLNSSDFNLSKIAGVESRHKNCTTFMITQNIFSDTKNFLHFKRQVRYFIIFNDGDQATVRFIRTRFPGMSQINLPASRFYLGDSQEGLIYDDDYNLIKSRQS